MMAALAHLAAVHALAAPAKPSPTPKPPPIPNPPAVPVPGLEPDLNTIIGWGKWLCFFLGTIGLIWCAMQMMVGRRNRHSYAADGAAGIPWVLAGLTLVAIAAGIAGTFLKP